MMEWSEALRKEATRVAEEYDSLLVQRHAMLQKERKTRQEIEMLNDLLEFLGEKRIQIETN